VIEKTLRDVQVTMSNCQNLKESAHAALQLLIEHSGAVRGHLFAVPSDGDGALLPMASTADAPSSALLQSLEQFLAREFGNVTRVVLAPEQTEAAPSDGRLEDTGGAAYYPVVLRSIDDGEELVQGIAALLMQPPQPPILPWRLIETISELLHNARAENSMAAALPP
jgi:GAF domain-containing protein